MCPALPALCQVPSSAGRALQRAAAVTARPPAQDVALPSGAPNDVDREYVLSYSIQDEVKSFFFAQNLAQLGTGLSNDQQTTLAADDTNAANEQFHTINGAPPAASSQRLARWRDMALQGRAAGWQARSGAVLRLHGALAASGLALPRGGGGRLAGRPRARAGRSRALRAWLIPGSWCVAAGMLYCNLPHLHAKVGDRVRLHIFALGTENGIHAPAIIASTMNLEARRLRTLVCASMPFFLITWAQESGSGALLRCLG